MIYLVEDDDEIRTLEEYALKSAGFSVRGFSDGAPFKQALEQERPSLVILDMMLPGEDGIALLRHVRAQCGTALPVMMVTAKSAELDVVAGLEGGADDYLSKPFGVLEFTSRVRALLRRAGAEAGKLAGGALHCGLVSLDDTRRQVTSDGQPVELTFKEYELLRLLLKNARRVVPREEILQKVWGTDFEGESRTLDMHVRTLRQKLGPGGEQLRTVRKVGSMFTDEEAGL